MIRFITFLLGRPYEPCKSCETLKEQLKFVNDEKRQLTETLLAIVKPKTVEAAPVELNPINQTAGIFSRRRSALEESERQRAAILKNSAFVGKPDIPKVDKDIEGLEKELGVEEEKAN